MQELICNILQKNINNDLAQILLDKKLALFDADAGGVYEIKIPYEILRSKRKTYGISIDSNGEVKVRIPQRATIASAKEFVMEKRKWVLEHYLMQMQKVLDKKAQEENCLYTEKELERAERYFRARAKNYFPVRVSYFARQMGVSYGNITIRDQKTRWGSRSSSGTLSFNWRLMLAPRQVLDYVVVHELAHVKQMNHSKAFWSEVEKIMPDYEIYRKWLKVHGSELTRQEAARQVYSEQ